MKVATLNLTKNWRLITGRYLSTLPVACLLNQISMPRLQQTMSFA